MSKNELNFPKLIPTKDKLTAAAGLGTLMELFDSSPLKTNSFNVYPKATVHVLLEVIY